MTVDLELAGRRYRATITSPAAGSRLRVVLLPLDPAGAIIEREVDIRETEHGYSMVHVPDGRVVDATVTATGTRDQWMVQLPGVDLEVMVNGRRHPAAEAAGAGGGEQRVCAPMPGRVLKVLVAAGDTVSPGQPVVVVEAMKMENALTARREGVVQEITVTEGLSVEAGRLLLRIG